MEPWYAVRTKSNCERAASIALSQKGYDSFLPTYSVQHRSKQRLITKERPLFPGYFFCRFDMLKRMPIMTTPGVLFVLGFGNDPTPVPESEIEAIQTVVRSGRTAAPYPLTREGDRIRINGGPMKGLEGVLVRHKADYRLVISVTMLQRSVAVEVDRDDIYILS